MPNSSLGSDVGFVNEAIGNVGEVGSKRYAAPAPFDVPGARITANVPKAATSAPNRSPPATLGEWKTPPEIGSPNPGLFGLAT